MSIDARVWPLLSTLLAGPAVAADTNRLLEDGGYLELGATVFVQRSIRAQLDDEGRRPSLAGAGFYVAGAWRKGPVFLEGRHGGLEGASLGLTLWHDERRALELLAAHVPGSVSLQLDTDDDGVDPSDDDRMRGAALLDRDAAFLTSGLRYREYRGDTLLQASAVVDWQHGNGVLLGLHAGRRWQLGNWNLQGAVGLRAAEADLVDFVYGVDEDEETTRFPAYRGENTLFGEVALGTTRALGRNWVWHTNLRARVFGDGIADSPLVAAGDALSADSGIAYVF